LSFFSQGRYLHNIIKDTPTKRIELAIESFSSRILKDKKLFIIGHVSKENKHYYYKLIDLCKKKIAILRSFQTLEELMF
jgi:hypothetical protein